ncbi:hypothetical protein WA158_000939 [Blastocystis sp. Blastoise]
MYNQLFVFILLSWISMTLAKAKLHVNENGDFKIVQFTDLHYGEDNCEDETYKCMQMVMKVAKPDFMAFTGDLIAGENWDHTQGWHEKLWRQWSNIANETQTYYGITLGNHDPNGELTSKEIMELDQTNPWSLSEVGPEECSGTSNYVIPVYDYKNNTKVIFNIWFLDSQYKSCAGIGGAACIEIETIEWYYKKSKELEKQYNRIIPGIAFFHIPTQEFMYAWDNNSPVGHKDQLASCPRLNTGIIAAMIKRGDIKAVYCGHEHKNDFIVNYESISLALGRKTGLASEGEVEDFKHGGRVLEISTKDQFSINNYIVNIDGEIEKQIKKEGILERQYICH